MGVLGLIKQAILGPLLIVCVLYAHIFYRLLLETPAPVSVQEFPKDFTQAAKDKLVASRKWAVDGFKAGLSGKASKSYLDKAADDIEFEDFWIKLQGKDEFWTLCDLTNRIVGKEADFEIRGVYHGVHETAVDWTQIVYLKWAPTFAIRLNMVSYFLFEPPMNQGGQEKLFRIQEEWGGNKQLNEKSAALGPIGRLHSKFRRFQGQAIVWISNQLIANGWL